MQQICTRKDGALLFILKVIRMKQENYHAVISAMAVHSGDRGIAKIPFRAGTGDKLIFNLILSPNSRLLDLAERDIESGAVKLSMAAIGMNAIAFLYGPNYGWWDERELRETQEKYGRI